MVENKLILTYYEKTLLHHKMIFVKGGNFEMGGIDDESYDREKPVHKIKISSFFIGKYPVTQALWQRVMGYNPSRFVGDFNRPVEQVRWTDTQDFIKTLNEKTGRSLNKGYSYRLPTEAEWEYTARGGLQTEGYLFAGSDKLKDIGWYNENSERQTQPVGQKHPNELGIYDMTGNVREWCADIYSNNYYEQCANEELVLNPTGPKSGTLRVYRGGSWNVGSRFCRITFRDYASSGNRANFLGFRLAMSAPSGGE